MPGTTLITIREGASDQNGHNATLSFNHEGEYEITIRDPFSEQEEERLEWYFEEHLQFPFLEQVKAKQAAESVTHYDEELFKQIFSEHDAYATYKAAAQNGLNTLHFEIAGSPKFHELHWEALKDPDLPKPFSIEAQMVRKNNGVLSPLHATLQPSPTINLLVVTARPFGGRDVGYRTISRPLVEGLRQAKLPVQIDILRPGTYQALANHLDETRAKHGSGHYHVIHFDVHGALLTFPELIQFHYRARYGRPDIKEYDGLKAFLFLEGDKACLPQARAGQADPVEAGELAALLLTHQTPITILNACQSGKQVGAAETSLGSRLMQAGVQMVLAMGYSVTVSAAELMMSILYEQLFSGQQLSEAIRRGRLELYNRKGRAAYFNQTVDLEDWLLPVTYQNQEVRLSPRSFAPEEEERYYSKQAGRYQSPQPVYGFVGRDLDILQIEKRLLAPLRTEVKEAERAGRNVLLLRGMGGAGKTTLLHHLGSWWQTTGFVDQVFYFGYDEKAYTLQQLLYQITAQLLTPVEQAQFQPKSLAAQQAMLAQRLRSQRHLLILDNLESVTGSRLAILNTLSAQEQNELKAFLADLVEGKTLVLLGSRGGEEWLAKETFGDNVYDLPGLDAEAASTLADRILAKHQIPLQQKDEIGKTRDLRDDPDFKNLLKLLDGYPLALEVVLANLTRQTPSQVLQALQAGDVSLDRGDTQKKTESILHCIDYSYSNISPESQALLFCLFPFTSVIFVGALKQYVEQLKQQPALTNLPFERFDEVMKEATNWGLLSPHPEAPEFLRLQPIFPYFLRSRVDTAAYADMRQAVETAFRQYYDVWSAGMHKLMTSKEAKEKQLGQVAVRFEYENLVTALRYALKEQVSIINIHAALSNYLDVIQGHQQGLELGEMVLAALEKYPTDKLAGKLGAEFVSVIDYIANYQRLLKHYRAAEESYKKALSIWFGNKSYEDEKKKQMSASIYHELGRVMHEQRNWQQAEQYYKKALEIKIEFNDRRGQALSYHNLGDISQEQRQWQQAEEYYKNALEIFIEFNDHYALASTYYQLGVLAQEQQQWQHAEQHYKKALEINIMFSDRYESAKTYHHLGRVAVAQQQWQQAEQYFKKALDILIEFNDRYNQALNYGQLGIVTQAQQQWQQARKYVLRALEIFLEFNDEHNITITLRSLAYLWQASGDTSLPGAVAAVLKIQPQEAEALLRELLQS